MDMINVLIHGIGEQKMLSKEERLLYSLAGVKKLLDILDVEEINTGVKSKDGITETVDCYKEIERCVAECIKNTKPYKFEDLQTEMQVYDNYLKECIEISVMCGRNIANHTVTFFRWGQEELEVVKFEDNRFYPVHIAK